MSLLLYGANGYTGALIARLSGSAGIQPILAGRNPAVARLADELRLSHRLFDLGDPAAVDQGLAGIHAVLHCAGPFSRTAQPMVDACLRRKVHYLDITGEVTVFEGCAARDPEARAAGVMLLPGVGFDVVPTDCLAAHLVRRLPSAPHLALGFQAPGRPSRGTAATIAENLHRGGLIRKDGRLTRVPTAYKTRTIDFGDGPQGAMTIPWGDVSTAYHSTKIPNIEFYRATPLSQRLGAHLLPVLGPILGSAPVQRLLRKSIDAGPAGPDDAQRARRRSLVWGEATDGTRKVVSRLVVPEGYTLTARTALAIAGRVLAGDLKPGFQTPSLAYGPDFILTIEGCTRSDEG